jgi:hypothetical protein
MDVSDIYRRANLYAHHVQIAIDATPFDGGQDGSVWHSDRNSVVKCFERQDNFTHELECYHRLRDAQIGWKIHDFNVPAFIGASQEHMVIEMGIVFPPYILDFGKAYLSDPGWEPHILQEWNDRMSAWWDEDVKQVRLALFALRRYGIWYYDAKPGNVMLKDWNPSLED